MKNIKVDLIKSENSFSFIYKDEVKHKLAVSEVSLLPIELLKEQITELFKDKSLRETIFEVANSCDVYGFYSRLNVPDVLRNKGIGKMLLKETLNYCKEQNILLLNTVNAYGDMSEKSLINFYEKNGMILIVENVMFYSHHIQNKLDVNVKKNTI